jgi:hypothetical protein
MMIRCHRSTNTRHSYIHRHICGPWYSSIRITTTTSNSNSNINTNISSNNNIINTQTARIIDIIRPTKRIDQNDTRIIMPL